MSPAAVHETSDNNNCRCSRFRELATGADSGRFSELQSGRVFQVS